MKVALISDIHGNLTALRSILADIKRANRIICLGDVAAVGPQPHETIAFIRKARWPCVLGNADETIAKSEREPHENIPEQERKRLMALDDWTDSEVESADRRFLASFKPLIEVNDERRALLCYHGSPRSNTEQILPTTSEKDLVKFFEGKRAMAYAGGHTHSQMVREFGGSLIINPGSVGLPFYKSVSGRVVNPAWAEYAVLGFSDNNLSVELRRTRYSRKDLEDAVLESGMPEPRWWLKDWV